MTDKTDPEEPVDPTLESDNDDSTTDVDDQQSDSGNSVDWEDRYKGLQRASEKKRTSLEKTIADLQEKLAATTETLETINSDASAQQTARQEAENKIAEIQSSLEGIQKERDELSAQLERQNIILKEYPSLAPFANFIPSGADDETFRSSLSEFADALKVYVKEGVKETISGSSHVTQDDDTMATGAEEDQLWNTVYSLAGIPGKEQEYQEAHAKLMGILEAKNT